MTKRKRTPPSSPPPPAQGPFQIPASLQRLSVISRSLAHQSDKLAGLDQDHQDAGMITRAQALGDVPAAVPAASAGTEAGKKRGKGFRAFAPRKQPSFPDTQTWVEPRPRGSRAPDHAGFMPPTQPSFPQGQSWPQPQPQKVITWPQLQPAMTAAASKSEPERVPSPVPLDAAFANLEAAPAEGETLCLETQPDRIAALIAQKRAANEANRRREAWTRRAAAHRVSSQAPDDQLLSELNSVLEQSPTADNSAQKHTSTPNDAGRPDTDGCQNPSDSEQYVHPTAAITFDPVVPSNRTQADTSSTAERKTGLTGGKKRKGGQTSAPFANSTQGTSSHGHDSLLSSSGSPSPSPAEHPKRGGGRGKHPAEQHNQHDSFEAQLSAAASTAPLVNPKVTNMPSNSTKTKTKANTRNPKTSIVPQHSQRDQPAPVAAGYYRFNPRHWQSSSTSGQQQQQQQQQRQQSQASAPDAQSGYQDIEANVWPASRNTPQKLQPNAVFRNLTQDKFGRFGVGGKLKEAAGQQSGAGT